MTVSALVNTERPIILIYNPDLGRPDAPTQINFKHAVLYPMTSSRTEQSYERAERLFQQAEAKSRHVADIEQRRLEEMQAKSERLRKLREERDAMTPDKQSSNE